MSSFNAIIEDTNTSPANPVDEFYEFPIGLLPDFITESSLFIMTLDLCPDSTTFPFLKSKMPTTLKIRSTEDFQRLVEADHMFGFTPKTQIQILESMYDFWLNDPNSSELPLPVKDFSHFGNQVRTLFTETNNIMAVRCFQGNYVELFDYLVKRDGLQSVDSGRWPDYSLPYYGAVCNHVEITRRGLEVGVAVAKDCIDQAINKQNQEMFDLFVSFKVKFSSKTLDLGAEKGLPEMYKYCLRAAINNNMLRKFVLKTLENKDNLEYLLHKSGTNLTSINGEELLEECLKNVYNVEIFQMVDAYFTKPEHMSNGKTLINKVVKFRPGFRYIPEDVIYKDNYELFTYLQSKGLWISEELIEKSIRKYKTNRLTPGFLKRQFAEQEAVLEIERMEALLDEEAREAEAQSIAEREDFERQID
jgi:hypothetical protein